MEETKGKLKKLHQSVQKLESVLQEVWSLLDEINEDDEFRNLKNQVKQYKTKKQGSEQHLAELCERLEEFNSFKEEIPEDGTSAVDFEDAISDLIDWIEQNK